MNNQIVRRREAVETSMGARDDVLPRVNITLVFVSPDGSKSAPMTLDELQRRYQERQQSSSS